MNLHRRPRLALPFTILAESDTVRLVAGEDLRYTLSAAGIERWLPDLLAALDGRRCVAELLRGVAPDCHAPALQLLERLYGERILVDGLAAERHSAASYPLAVAGTGWLADALRAGDPGAEAARLHVLCQDRLDYDEVLRFNERCRAGTEPYLWVSSGAMERGYVSPVVWPDAGPCLACLLRQFQRLSPAPEIYDHLIAQARGQRPIAPAPFPPEGLAILKQLVLWKQALLRQPLALPALYRLQVLENAALEVTAHRVLADPECPVCGEAG